MKKILVIDDSEIVKENLVDLLEVNDFEVISADNGLEGYEKAINEQPDLIMSDVMMPELDGYSLARKLQSNPKTDSIPLIFLSAKAELADIREGMKIGAEDYITKPFTSMEVIDAIKLRLSKKDKFNKEINDFKDELLNKFNHELRNPLTPVIGLTELLNEEFDNLSKDEAIEFLDVIKKSGNNLSKKIEKIILLSELDRIYNDSEMVIKQRSQVCTKVAEIINSASKKVASCNKRENDLILYTNSKLVFIDEHDLKSIIIEVVDNAFKFSKEGTKVVIETEDMGDLFSIKIKDNGIGFTSQQLNKVSSFHQFTRENSLSGLGTGLSVVKKILEIYDGAIELNFDVNFSTIVNIKLRTQH